MRSVGGPDERPGFRLDPEIFRVGEERRVRREGEPQARARREPGLVLHLHDPETGGVQPGVGEILEEDVRPAAADVQVERPVPERVELRLEDDGGRVEPAGGYERGAARRDRAALPREEPGRLERQEPHRAHVDE